MLIRTRTCSPPWPDPAATSFCVCVCVCVCARVCACVCMCGGNANRFSEGTESWGGYLVAWLLIFRRNIVIGAGEFERRSFRLGHGRRVTRIKITFHGAVVGYYWYVRWPTLWGPRLQLWGLEVSFWSGIEACVICDSIKNGTRLVESFAPPIGDDFGNSVGPRSSLVNSMTIFFHLFQVRLLGKWYFIFTGTW